MSKFSSDSYPNVSWMVLLLVPFGGALWFPFLDRADPAAWGIPSFIWYQFLWIAGSVLVTGLLGEPRPLGQMRRMQDRG